MQQWESCCYGDKDPGKAYLDGTWCRMSCVYCCTCCGFSPVVGLVKGTLCAVAVTVIVGLGCTLAALLWTPHHIVLTYYTLTVTPAYGASTKLLWFLFLPVLFALYVPVTAALAITGGVLAGFFVPFYRTFGDYAGGVTDVLNDSVFILSEFWVYNSRVYVDYLAGLRQETTRRYTYIFIILGGLPLSLLGLVLDGVVISLLLIFKCPLAVLGGYYGALRVFCSMGKTETSFFLLGFPVLIIWLLVWPFTVALGLAIGDSFPSPSHLYFVTSAKMRNCGQHFSAFCFVSISFRMAFFGFSNYIADHLFCLTYPPYRSFQNKYKPHTEIFVLKIRMWQY